MVGGAFGSYVDDDSSSLGSFEAAIIALGGFTGPTGVVACALTSTGIPSAADFDIVVSDASTIDLVPITPLPRVVVESIDCVGVTTTTQSTTTSTTTTVLAPTTTLPPATTTTTLPAGDAYPCEIEFSVVTSSVLGSLQWDTVYSGAAGEMAGVGDLVECSSLIAGSFASYHDDDAGHTLTAALISIGGFAGPAAVSSCSFMANGAEPLASDFVNTLVDVSGPNFEGISPLPEVIVSDVYCGLGATTTTTSTSTSTTSTLPLPVCGNGVIELGEACDDANASNRDSCLNDCTLAYCGDGFVNDASEECDDGAANSDVVADACRSDCSAAYCGDAVLDSGEECDQGLGNSDIAADACRSDCVAAYCGDAVLDSGEDCDDGVANSDSLADACRSMCVVAYCGDDVVDSGEDCDDGIDNSDADPLLCRSDCSADTVCGDADGGGSVSVVDAQVVLKAGIGLLADCPLLACDANGDGSVSVGDAQRILAASIGLPSELSCALKITVSLDQAVSIGSLQLDIDYAATGDTFLGAGSSVACTGLAGAGSIAAFNNDVETGILTVGIISTVGVNGPADIAECRFRASAQLPASTDFIVTVAEAADASGTAVAAPAVSLSY